MLEETITEIHRALLELGITSSLISQVATKAKGKMERPFKFIQERFISEHIAKDLEELNSQFQYWIDWYNANIN